MRDVPGGWFIRYMHSTGASFFFIVVYLHMFRGLMYGSYRTPRELVWIFGCLIFLSLMGEAFFGYLLPWGQMSYWGAQVIVNLFGAIPLIGPDLSIWIRGDYVIGDATLNRFFSFHVIAIPLVLIGLVAAHILALHDVGSNNPDGVEIKKKLDANGRPLDGIPFHPYYTVHDIFWLAHFPDGVLRRRVLRAGDGRLFPRVEQLHPGRPAADAVAHRSGLVLHAVLFDPARDDRAVRGWCSPLGTIALSALLVLTVRNPIVRAALAVGTLVLLLGYFTLDPKFWGVVLMGASVLIFLALPWLDQSPVKSMRYRPGWHFWLLIVWVAAFVVLGYFGTQPPSPAGQYSSMARHGHLLRLLRADAVVESRWATFKPVPDRVTFRPH